MESEDEEEIVVNIDVETGGYLFEWSNSFICIFYLSEV